MICKSLLTYRINKKNKFKFLVKKKIKIVGLSKGEKIHKELITHNELARTYFLNNCIKKNNNLIKKNFEDEFRSDMPYNLNIKQIKNFLIKDLKLLIPKFYKEHH
jgi:FlaA1/EpsC-like NDP-sugar epimerase